MAIAAYVLSVLAMPFVRLCCGLFFLGVLAALPPLQQLILRRSGVDQIYAGMQTSLAAFFSVAVSYGIFKWANANFSLVPVLILAALAIGNDLQRIRRSLGTWHVRLVEVGLDKSDLVPSDQDLESRLLYDDVGREIAYLLGDVLGFGIGGWYFLR